MKASGSLGQLMLLIFPAITACNLNSTEIHFPIPSNVSLPKQQINHYANATMVNDHGVDHLLEMGGSVLGDSFNGRIQIQNLVSNVTSNHEAKCMRSWTCKVDGCHRQASFAFKGEKTGTHCGQHRKAEHIDIRHKRTCEHVECMRRACFGSLGDAKPRWCAKHRGVDDHPISRMRCCHAGCHTHPVYGDPVTRKREFCLKHKSIHHIKLNAKKQFDVEQRERQNRNTGMFGEAAAHISHIDTSVPGNDFHRVSVDFSEVQRTIKVVQPRDCGSNLLQDFEKHIWIPHLCEQNASMAASYLFHDLPYAKGELFCADELRFQVQQVDGPCH